MKNTFVYLIFIYFLIGITSGNPICSGPCSSGKECKSGEK